MSHYKKSMVLIIALVLTFGLMVPILASANSYTIYPVADASVCSGYNNNNYNEEYLFVGFFPGYLYRRSYLKFDLSSIPLW